MTSQYSIFTRAELIGMLKENNAELTKLQATEEVKPDPINKQMIAKLTTKDNELRTAISSSQATTSPASSSHQDYKFIQLANSMSSAMKDIKRLEPGVPSENFIASLRNVYELLVKPDVTNHPRLETEFLKQARLRMAETYNTQLLNSGTQVSTFEEFQSYIAKTHGSQLTNYQLLSRAWDLELGQSESLTDFATKLELRMRDAAQQIEARFVAEKKSATNPNPTMTSETVFQLVGGMLMSEKIKQRSPKIFSHLVRTMDKHYSASTIAHEAKLYEERLGDQGDSILAANNFFAHKSKKRNQKPKSKAPKPSLPTSGNKLTKEKFDQFKTQGKDCNNAKNGKPCYYKPCPFRHANGHVANLAYVTENSSNEQSTDFQYGLLA